MRRILPWDLRTATVCLSFCLRRQQCVASLQQVGYFTHLHLTQPSTRFSLSISRLQFFPAVDFFFNVCTVSLHLEIGWEMNACLRKQSNCFCEIDLLHLKLVIKKRKKQQPCSFVFSDISRSQFPTMLFTQQTRAFPDQTDVECICWIPRSWNYPIWDSWHRGEKL